MHADTYIILKVLVTMSDPQHYGMRNFNTIKHQIIGFSYKWFETWTYTHVMSDLAASFHVQAT